MNEFPSMKMIERVTSEVLRNLKHKEEIRINLIDWIKLK